MRLTAGYTQFFPGTSAGSATITNAGGLVSGAPGGFLEFGGNGVIDSTADQATVLNAPARSPGRTLGGLTQFNGGTGAAATFTNEGGQGVPATARSSSTAR